MLFSDHVYILQRYLIYIFTDSEFLKYKRTVATCIVVVIYAQKFGKTQCVEYMI